MRSYKLFILDLDGTMYRGDEPIPEAPRFIQELEERGQEYLFLTNNATKTPQDVVQLLARFNMRIQPEKVYTTSVAAARYITRLKEAPRVYAVGEEALIDALAKAGCRLISSWEELERCDVVVMGLDRQVSYQKLAKACAAVRKGAAFISTNGDRAIPTEKGLLPGNGALTAVVRTATGIEPTFIGKPEPFMVELILQETGVRRDEILLIGDNYETDIKAGLRAGIDTALVLTGYTQREEVPRLDPRPTYVWEHLLEAFA